MNPENVLALQEDPFYDFGTILDNTCTKLQYKQAQHLIHRLQELDAILEGLEKELDMLVPQTLSQQ